MGLQHQEAKHMSQLAMVVASDVAYVELLVYVVANKLNKVTFSQPVI